MYNLLLAVLVMNVVDMVLTLCWVLLGVAVEANPVMASALDQHLLWFAGSKIALVSLSVVLLWNHRERVLVRFATTGIALLYAWVIYQHAPGVPHLKTALLLS